MEKKFTGNILWDSPYIIYCPFVPNTDWWGFSEIQEQLKDQKVYFLKNICWTVEDEVGIDRIKNWNSQYLNPNHSFLWIGNSHKEIDNMNSHKIESYFIHQNSFLDPNIFNITHLKKAYSAVYNAAIMPYKRLELAAEVNSLALISRSKQQDYFDQNVTKRPNFHLINSIVDGHLQFIGKDRVNDVYNKSYCGLCLSAIEGAMYASVEYLLSGIPVVSTKSIGGRDYFLDRTNSIMVEDNVTSVRDAVDYWVKNYDINRALDIRKNTITMQRDGISRMKILIAKILCDNNVFLDVETLFNYSFVNNFLRYYKAEDFLREEIKRLAQLKQML